MVEALVSAFVVLFIVVDPIGIAAIFAALTRDADTMQRYRMAVRGTVLGLAILVIFTVVGDLLLRTLGIGLPAFRIAGGILLFLLAIDMVFARESGLRTTTEAERRDAGGRDDISVFPLAFPLLTGPGAITTVLLLTSERHEPLFLLALLGVIVVIFAITLGALLAAGRITAVLGPTGINIFSRLLGLILAALSTQYILDGIEKGLLGR